MGDNVNRDIYQDPQARARAAELARWSKAALVNLALDAQTGASRASLMKWHKQVLAWTITCAEHTGLRAQAVTGRGGAPAAGTAAACRPPARTAEQEPAPVRQPADRPAGAPGPAR